MIKSLNELIEDNFSKNDKIVNATEFEKLHLTGKMLL